MNDTTNPPQGGTLADEYEIYKACAESLGWPVKSFNEWLNS